MPVAASTAGDDQVWSFVSKPQSFVPVSRSIPKMRKSSFGATSVPSGRIATLPSNQRMYAPVVAGSSAWNAQSIEPLAASSA